MGFRMSGGNCCCYCVVERDAYVEAIAVTPPDARRTKQYPNQSPPFPGGQSGDIIAYDHKNRRTFTTRSDRFGVFSVSHDFDDRQDHLVYHAGSLWRTERGLCVDPVNEYIYFVARPFPNTDWQYVRRVGYDGSGETTITSDFGFWSASASELAISKEPKYVFWSKLTGFGAADPNFGTLSDMVVLRVSPNGTTDEIARHAVFAPGSSNPWVTTGGFGIDNGRNKLYYAIWCNGTAAERRQRVYRCNFDGSESELVWEQVGQPEGLSQSLRFAGYAHVTDRIYWVNTYASGSNLRFRSAKYDGTDVRTEADTKSGAMWNGRNSPISLRLACGYQRHPLATH